MGLNLSNRQIARELDLSQPDVQLMTEQLRAGLVARMPAVRLEGEVEIVPDGPTQELRALLRNRKQLVRERAGHAQRLQKTLEDANVKLDAVFADLLGASGRAMLEALAAGESDPAALAALAHPRLA